MEVDFHYCCEDLVHNQYEVKANQLLMTMLMKKNSHKDGDCRCPFILHGQIPVYHGSIFQSSLEKKE